ncbi:MAG: hypothetical protein KF863_21480 [Rubrivivax sp.]|nr:hypothetical protein [Rubrivivax sp.]
MRVFIGYDAREAEAAKVAARSLHRVSGGQLAAELLDVETLRQRGVLTRIRDERLLAEYDLVSNKLYSTRFNIARFLVPILCQNGPALFVDCDVVFVRDPRDILEQLEPPDDLGYSGCALWVVQHDHRPRTDLKMVDQVQREYPRKNWSSVMLFNCDHEANRRLSLWDVNNRHRDELHGFYWLHDSEIGELSPEWNWLVGVQPKPQRPAIAHFTLGGPWLPGWKGAEHDELWLEAAKA